jgi:catechol 2,3-dioxygenase-like lactoylglutathione lyase family enzyme
MSRVTKLRSYARSKAESSHLLRASRTNALRGATNLKIQLTTVWHFSFAVSDPEKSAQFWTENFDLKEMFRSDEAIALTNDALIIGFFKGTPQPDTMDHMSFRLDSMRALREALQTLKKNGVNLEDPDNEIGPTSSDSPHMGLWFHDPDGYRWELSVQNGARER